MYVFSTPIIPVLQRCIHDDETHHNIFTGLSGDRKHFGIKKIKRDEIYANFPGLPAAGIRRREKLQNTFTNSRVNEKTSDY